MIIFVTNEVITISESVSKVWFCVLDNPESHGYNGTPEEIVSRVISEWCMDDPTKSCVVAYCISESGMEHLHAVFCSSSAMRFSAIKKIYGSFHIAPMKGTRKQALDYIYKRNSWATEKNERIIHVGEKGEITDNQGHRRDLEIIEDLLNEGKTPQQIMALSLGYRKYEKIIKDCFFDLRSRNTPVLRDIVVYWHVGPSGSGKTFTYVQLVEKHGDDVYILTDFDVGGLDKYAAEKYLFIDDVHMFNGHSGLLKYHTILNSILSPYKVQVHARYSNIIGLWSEVHITSVFPPEIIFQNMVDDSSGLDTYEQLRRRISFMVYHWKTPDGNYHSYQQPMSIYISYENLKLIAENGDIYDLPDDIAIPFDND